MEREERGKKEAKKRPADRWVPAGQITVEHNGNQRHAQGKVRSKGESKRDNRPSSLLA